MGPRAPPCWPGDAAARRRGGRRGRRVVQSLQDNTLGRLLTLADGVFAIAMTLLTFDLKVPNIGQHPSESALRHALGHQTSAYLSFILSFYVIAGYWRFSSCASQPGTSSVETGRGCRSCSPCPCGFRSSTG
jgi:hypothetical protein